MSLAQAVRKSETAHGKMVASVHGVVQSIAPSVDLGELPPVYF